MTYLVSEYAADDALYPKDVRTRAMVDQRIQFDLGTLYARLADYFVWAILKFQLKTNDKEFNEKRFAVPHNIYGGAFG